MISSTETPANSCFFVREVGEADAVGNAIARIGKRLDAGFHHLCPIRPIVASTPNVVMTIYGKSPFPSGNAGYFDTSLDSP